MKITVKNLNVDLSMSEIYELENELFEAGFHEGADTCRSDLTKFNVIKLQEEFPKLMRFRELLAESKTI